MFNQQSDESGARSAHRGGGCWRSGADLSATRSHCESTSKVPQYWKKKTRSEENSLTGTGERTQNSVISAGK